MSWRYSLSCKKLFLCDVFPLTSDETSSKHWIPTYIIFHVFLSYFFKSSCSSSTLLPQLALRAWMLLLPLSTDELKLIETRCWSELHPLLRRFSVIFSIDLLCLAIYCSSYSCKELLSLRFSSGSHFPPITDWISIRSDCRNLFAVLFTFSSYSIWTASLRPSSAHSRITFPVAPKN